MVVLSLKITANGTVAAIKVVKSSNKVFSDEAIRIVKEASGWVAGRIGENRIADSVKVRIVFKPKK